MVRCDRFPLSDLGRQDQRRKSDDVDDLVVDGNLLTCLAACECTQDACSVKDDLFDLNIQIDARLEDEGDSVVGTLVLGSERIPVLMARM